MSLAQESDMITGQWSGTTSQEFPIKIYIEEIENTLTVTEIGYWIKLKNSDGRTTRSVQPKRAVEANITEMNFNCRTNFPYSDSIVLTGNFTADTILSGVLTVTYVNPEDSSVYNGEVSYETIKGGGTVSK